MATRNVPPLLPLPVIIVGNDLELAALDSIDAKATVGNASLELIDEKTTTTNSSLSSVDTKLTTTNTRLTSIDNGIKFADGAILDAFSRVRVSHPETLFDSKLIYADADIGTSAEIAPFFFDNAATSGSGTSTSTDVNRGSILLSVSNATAGTRVRQTKQRFNYQPGKSQFIVLTAVLGAAQTGITKRLGYFDENNGLYFQLDSTGMSVVRRTRVSGSVVNTAVASASWNIDSMDGSGPSGITLNPALTQIYVIDFQWLGVGRIRFGVDIDGLLYYVHEIFNANVLSSVYMSTPNLPVRAEIVNSGVGPVSSLEQICCTVISEGGHEETGLVRGASTASFVNANTANTLYALLGIRLRSTHLGLSVILESLSAVAATADNFKLYLLLNPTVAGSFTYANLTQSGLQIAFGDIVGNPSANTVTGGIALYEDITSNLVRTISVPFNSKLRLGSLINGTPDEIVLAASPLTGASNVDIHGAMGWRELL